MSRVHLRVFAIVAGTLIALATSMAVVSAHAVFTAGKYRLAIGWQNEPSSGTDTYVGDQNAIQVFIDIASADDPKGTPVSKAQRRLRASRPSGHGHRGDDDQQPVLSGAGVRRRHGQWPSR